MSEEKTPEIEFVLSPEQKGKAGRILNDVNMTPFVTFPDEHDVWEFANTGATFFVRIASGAGWLKIPLTDEQIVGLLKQLMDGMTEQAIRANQILADVSK